MQFFSFGHRAHGVIAIGQEAVGVIAIGQLALGVVSVGQLSRGVLAVGQLAVGVWAYGQLAVGLSRAVGMLALGARAAGMLRVSLWPKAPESGLPAESTLDAVLSGAVRDGWVRATLSARDGAVTARAKGAPLAVEFASGPRAEAAALASRGAVALLRVAREDRVGAADEGGYRAAPDVRRVLLCSALAEVRPWWRAVGPGNLALRAAAFAVLVALYAGAVVVPWLGEVAVGMM